MMIEICLSDFIIAHFTLASTILILIKQVNRYIHKYVHMYVLKYSGMTHTLDLSY